MKYNKYFPHSLNRKKQNEFAITFSKCHIYLHCTDIGLIYQSLSFRNLAITSHRRNFILINISNSNHSCEKSIIITAFLLKFSVINERSAFPFPEVLFCVLWFWIFYFGICFPLHVLGPSFLARRYDYFSFPMCMVRTFREFYCARNYCKTYREKYILIHSEWVIKFARNSLPQFQYGVIRFYSSYSRFVKTKLLKLQVE